MRASTLLAFVTLASVSILTGCASVKTSSTEEADQYCESHNTEGSCTSWKIGMDIYPVEEDTRKRLLDRLTASYGKTEEEVRTVPAAKFENKNPAAVDSYCKATVVENGVQRCNHFMIVEGALPSSLNEEQIAAYREQRLQAIEAEMASAPKLFLTGKQSGVANSQRILVLSK